MSLYIPRECERSYIEQTGRLLAETLHKDRYNLKEDPLEKSKLAQRACREGLRAIWDEASISEIASKIRYRKYKESATQFGILHLYSPYQQQCYQLTEISMP
jgi:hypothetical protein